MDEYHNPTRSFRCYGGPPFDPKELCIVFCGGDQGIFNWDELQSKWDEFVSIHSNVRLTVGFKEGWSGNPIVWEQFCDFVEKVAPGICSFSTTFTSKIGDHEWANFLQRLPSNLLELNITTQGGNPLAFRQIGRSFPNLKNLVVYYGPGCRLSVASEVLPEVIRSLPALRRLTLWNMPVATAGISWKALILSIQGREQLEAVNIHPGYTIFGRTLNSLSDEDLEAIQYRPRLNEAITRHIADGKKHPTTLEEFVEVIIAVRERLDCLWYFFSEADPSLFAPATADNLVNATLQAGVQGE